MVKRRMTVLHVVFMAAFTAVFFLSGFCAQPVAAAEEYMFKMVGTLPVTHHITKAAEVFKNAVERDAKGKVKIQFYPAGQLYNDKDVLNTIPKGAVELGLVQTGPWAGLSPSVSLLNMPTFYSDMDHLWRVIDGEPGEMIKKDLEEKGVVILGAYDYGWVECNSKKPIKKLEDFKGLRIRGFGANLGIWLQAMGASPISLAPQENYEALQRGTIDGALTGLTSVHERKLYEVAKYVTYGLLVQDTIYYMMVNRDAWKKLTPELQEVFVNAAKEARVFNKKACEDANNEAVDILKGLGVTFAQISKEELNRIRLKTFRAVADDYYATVGAEKGKKILAAAEALRTLKSATPKSEAPKTKGTKKK